MTAVALDRTRPGRRYGLRNAVAMEWIRLRSLRSTYWLLAVCAVATIGIGVATLSAYRTHVPRPGAAQMVNDGLAGAALGQLLIGFLGVLTITSEYSSGMIRATLAAVPDRRTVLAAKAAVFGGVALVAAEVICFVTFFASQAALAGSPVPRSSLGDPGVARTIVLTGVYLALIGLIGLGLGALLRHPGGTVGALFGILFVPLFVLGAMGPASVKIANYMPMFMLVNSIGVVQPTTGCLPAWPATGVMCLYAAAALVAGGWRLVRRDA